MSFAQGCLLSRAAIGTPFADQPRYRSGPTARLRGHAFDRVCREHGIEHRLTKPYHPWTNRQAERMNRTVKDATVKVFHSETLASLSAHVRDGLQLRQAPESAAMANPVPGDL